MDKIGQEALLFDFYGQLLTDKQIQILEMHVNDDFSLGEISEELGISRQGVHDTVKRSVKALEDYEKRLGLVSRHMSQKEVLNELRVKIESLQADIMGSEKLEAKIADMKTIMDKLL